MGTARPVPMAHWRPSLPRSISSTVDSTDVSSTRSGVASTRNGPVMAGARYEKWRSSVRLGRPRIRSAANVSARSSSAAMAPPWIDPKLL